MTKKNRLVALLLSVLMIASMLTVGVFAEDHDHASETSSGFFTTEVIVNIVIFGIIIIVAAILCIKFRKKLGAFLRSVKSELKKVVWASGNDTRKNFLVVVVLTVAIAAIIGIIDWAVSNGISELVQVISKARA